MQFLNNKITF